MATAAVHNDLTTCSICFEKFRTPRILPCSHVFCQSCISSYIVSACQSKKAPVGFSCPICREFIPSPVVSGKPDTWADGLPLCRVLETLIKIGELKLCTPCQRENDEEEATDICVTCEEPICGNCAKYHRRNLTLQTHRIIPINEPNRAMEFLPSLNKRVSCPQHQDKEVELYCNQHQTPCCALCAGEEHRNCLYLETIKSASEKIKKQDVVKILGRKIIQFEKELSSSNEKYEENLTEIESKSDSIKEVTKRLRKAINDHLDKIENEHMNELGEVTKKSREILNSCIDSVSDRIQFSRHCIQRLQTLEETSDVSDACFMMEYLRIKETFGTLERQTMKTKGVQLKLESNIPDELDAIRNLTHFCKICMSQSEMQLTRRKNVSDMSLSLVNEFQLRKANICSGTLLPDGNIALANFNSKEIGLFILRLKLDTWETLQNFKSTDHLFDVKHTENNIYVSNFNKKSVTIMTSDRYNTVKEFKMLDDLVPYGMSLERRFLFVACDSAILKYTLEGGFIHKYLVESRTLYVTVTDFGHIVYTNRTTGIVTCINESGQIQWQYKNPKLVSPSGVDRDESDNLYVCGSDSNNIHILSSNGTLIKIIEDISCPAFVKLYKDIDMFCVCSSWKNIQMYKIK